MAAPKRISSRDNPTVRHLRSLSGDARYRREQGRAVLDGPHLVRAALDADVPLLRLVFDDSAAGSRGREIAELQMRAAALNVPMLEVPATLFRMISPVDNPAGILAEISIPDVLAGGPCAQGDVIVLDGVQDAGNLGTLLRTAAAAGIRQAWLGEECAQAWSPKVLRAGMGAHFLLAIEERVALAGRLQAFEGERIATLLSPSARDLYACDLRAATAWLFGAEGRGLSNELASLSTQHVSIPMPGGAESLNVAAAAAVCFFEQVRQRRVAAFTPA